MRSRYQLVAVAGTYSHCTRHSSLRLVAGSSVGSVPPHLLYAMGAGAVVVTEGSLSQELASMGLQVQWWKPEAFKLLNALSYTTTCYRSCYCHYACACPTTVFVAAA